MGPDVGPPPRQTAPAGDGRGTDPTRYALAQGRNRVTMDVHPRREVTRPIPTSVATAELRPGLHRASSRTSGHRFP